MSVLHEGCQLTIHEIAAVLSLSGKEAMIGFQNEDIQTVTQESMWNACCNLVRDAMMTQIDGMFRLSRELVDVMKPVCMARSILSLTPGSDGYAQLIFYSEDTVTSMERTPFGRYALMAMDREEVSDMLQEHLEIEFPETEPGEEDLPPDVTVQISEPRESLLQGARFLLEQLDIGTGQRMGWARLIEQGVLSWLQWTEKGQIQCVPLTKETLTSLLRTLL